TQSLPSFPPRRSSDLDETLDDPPAPAREQTSFRSLLAELDGMEQGLKTDFDDLLEAQAADIDSDEEQSTP
ncbi:MAG TPA: SMC-Scp complex subunit ScpB, partial [Pseudomonas sp.]|nr:SMC-Scp complex subunit ScpB [Pseudomonas sp.]